MQYYWGAINQNLIFELISKFGTLKITYFSTRHTPFQLVAVMHQEVDSQPSKNNEEVASAAWENEKENQEEEENNTNMMWNPVFIIFSLVFAFSFGVMLGGWKEIDVHDEEAINVTNFAVVQHNKASNDLYVSQVMEVVKVAKQVSSVR